MKLGIVGLPNVGKSTLFNSLTKAGAESANYPFCTIDPNVGIVPVPDERIKNLGELYHSAKVTPAVVEFVDIAGLVKGASKGEGLGNQFLANIREVDAIVHVVRCFENSNITLKKLMDALTEGRQAKTVEPDDEDEAAFIASLNLLTSKPVIYAANVSESDLADDGASNPHVTAVREFAAKEGSEVFVICAEIEAEISELDDDEKKMFLEDLGLEKSGLDKLISASYSLLGLISYLTSGADETRAWTITKGTKAPQAAGKIHSDFERGFIRAEVVSYQDLMDCQSYVTAREKGLVRLEGKDYVVQDGDVILFRFNV